MRGKTPAGWTPPAGSGPDAWYNALEKPGDNSQDVVH